MATVNRFSILASLDPDQLGDSIYFSDKQSRVSRNRSTLRSPAGDDSEMIFKEAITLRDELLALINLSDYENLRVRSVTKTIKDDVIFLQKAKPFDSNRMASLKERMIQLKRSIPVRVEPLDKNRKGMVESVKPVCNELEDVQFVGHVVEERSKIEPNSVEEDSSSEEGREPEDEEIGNEEASSEDQRNAKLASSQTQVCSDLGEFDPFFVSACVVGINNMAGLDPSKMVGDEMNQFGEIVQFSELDLKVFKNISQPVLKVDVASKDKEKDLRTEDTEDEVVSGEENALTEASTARSQPQVSSGEPCRAPFFESALDCIQSVDINKEVKCDSKITGYQLGVKGGKWTPVHQVLDCMPNPQLDTDSVAKG